MLLEPPNEPRNGGFSELSSTYFLGSIIRQRSSESDVAQLCGAARVEQLFMKIFSTLGPAGLAQETRGPARHDGLWSRPDKKLPSGV